VRAPFSLSGWLVLARLQAASGLVLLGLSSSPIGLYVVVGLLAHTQLQFGAAPTRPKSSSRLQLATGSGLEATRGGTKHSMASARTARGEMPLIPRVGVLLLGYALYIVRAATGFSPPRGGPVLETFC
jgi:hypothetical protein